MTREEFKRIVAALKSNYRTFDLSTKEQFDFWVAMLGDLDYKLIQAAVEKLVCQSPYTPTIADIRKAAMEVVSPKLLGGADAWGEVVKAMRNYGSYNVEEALESLSPLTRKVVKMMGFRELCVSENPMADRAHFLKMYQELERRESNDRALALPVRDKIQSLQGKVAIDGVKMLSEKLGSI